MHKITLFRYAWWFFFNIPDSYIDIHNIYVNLQCNYWDTVFTMLCLLTFLIICTPEYDIIHTRCSIDILTTYTNYGNMTRKHTCNINKAYQHNSVVFIIVVLIRVTWLIKTVRDINELHVDIITFHVDIFDLLPRNVISAWKKLFLSFCWQYMFSGLNWRSSSFFLSYTQRLYQ